MAKAKTKKRASLISPVGIAHYAYVWKAQINRENPEQDPKFSVTLVFPKKSDIEYLHKAIEEAAIKKFGDKAKKMIAQGKLQLPIRDGDEDREDDPLYKGKYFFSAKSTQAPGVVDQDREPIEDQFDFYSGCKCRVSIYPYGYDVKGNKGVAFSLNNVQKIADGERLSGRGSAEDDFDDGEEYGTDDEDEDEDDDTPVRGKKSKSKSKSSRKAKDEDDEDEDDEDDSDDDEDDEDDEPAPRRNAKSKKSKASRRAAEDDDEDEDEDDEDEDDEDEDDDPPPRRRRR